MVRHIGIRHRVKQTREGEAKPTQVCVLVGDNVTSYDLATETDELDWVLGQFPTSWRLATQADETDLVIQKLQEKRPHHIRRKKVRKNQDPEALNADGFVVVEENDLYFLLEIPAETDGLGRGDVVAMALGGSGDRLAFALSKQAESFANGTKIMRIKPMDLKFQREDRLQRDKNDDAQTLAELVRDYATLFFKTTRKDRDLIRLVEAWRNRVEAMKARIGSEQRLRSHMIGKIFCSEEGQYPEGEIELLYEKERSNDRVIQALAEEQKAREKEVSTLLRSLDVYNELFVPIKGMGPMIAARIIVAVGDVRRFPTAPKLKAFLGAHVKRGGENGDPSPRLQFPRRRTGETANWHPDGRQALYLLADQFNRNPDSEWGQKLREYKVKVRAKHGNGEPVMVRSGLVDAYRAAEQLFLEMYYLDDVIMGHREITNLKDYEAWVKDLMHQCLALDYEKFDENDMGTLEEKLKALTPKDEGKMISIYSNGHIHRMASWKTVTKFVEWLWREWTRLEERNR
ncbi:hypothetical protein COT97_04525 [Candidatus Falkowbacteria bacterium CG10_big_fil_rev_8_21_14_0_10_39_11]|uniref:Transposase IS116/IS110/IS902 C-terminal domain-containing protein n=1 Tax=Candidatus Falkowbacteria bacterium CG10_big_fil_rev_8_21_14_0_10_39_11 TaxID=1974565 RepID=A0A2H0V3X1_9BACT|nr:MAG: hypothetical protein COT97_04525 [Candidatus Falkowbacteria bacterium CG10_big_fil_rev_8_21_14_0_10_39_11]